MSETVVLRKKDDDVPEVLPTNEIIENEEDESTTIKFSSNQDSKIMEWVLSQSPNAQPIAPQEFVNWWKIIIKTLNVYLE